jgi:hypothetical protein
MLQAGHSCAPRATNGQKRGIAFDRSCGGPAANGASTPDNCLVSASQAIMNPPSGTLTNDRASHVIGTISGTIKDAIDPASAIVGVGLVRGLFTSALEFSAARRRFAVLGLDGT